jgi:putative hydrolase of the HAD superfamily
MVRATFTPARRSRSKKRRIDMRKKTVILDLDNTIYPVHSIGNELFYTLFKLIEESGEYNGNLQEIKNDIMRRPFQKLPPNINSANT